MPALPDASTPVVGAVFADTPTMLRSSPEVARPMDLCGLRFDHVAILRSLSRL
jgi:hypothetical protein